MAGAWIIPWQAHRFFEGEAPVRGCVTTDTSDTGCGVEGSVVAFTIFTAPVSFSVPSTALADPTEADAFRGQRSASVPKKGAHCIYLPEISMPEHFYPYPK